MTLFLLFSFTSLKYEVTVVCWLQSGLRMFPVMSFEFLMNLVF
jgi:hypothetical protein